MGDATGDQRGPNDASADLERRMRVILRYSINADDLVLQNNAVVRLFGRQRLHELFEIGVLDMDGIPCGH